MIMAHVFDRRSVREPFPTIAVKQLCTYSHDADYNIAINNKSQLRLYRFPHLFHLSNLSLYGPAAENQMPTSDTLGDPSEKQRRLRLLTEVMGWERHALKKTDADFLGHEKFFKLILRSCHRNQKNGTINMIWFDGQIFTSLGDKFRVDDRFGRKIKERRQYDKLNFRNFTTEPWNVHCPEKCERGSNYCNFIQTSVGSVKLFFAGKIDSVQGYSITESSVEELKDTIALYSHEKVGDSKTRGLFAKRLKHAWVEAKLKGREKSVFAFTARGGRVLSVEEFQTSEIPQLYSEYILDDRPKDRLYLENSFAHCEALLSWVKQIISKDTSKAWQLKFQRFNNKITLRELEGDEAVNAQTILSDEFIEWRKRLENEMPESYIPERK